MMSKLSKQFNPEIVFILYWGRSGSVFMQSLLDSHPQTFSTPGTVLFSFFSDWEHWGATYVGKSDDQSWNAVCADFCEQYPTLFDSDPDPTWCNLDSLGLKRDQKIELSIPFFQEQFEYLRQQASLQEPIAISRRWVFILAHLAYEKAKGNSLNDKHLIVYPKHVPDFNAAMVDALSDFPDARILGMVRDPIRGFFSHLRMHIQERRAGRYELAKHDYDISDVIVNEQFFYFLRHLLSGWNELQSQHPELSLKAIQLEAMHENPEEQMRDLAQWLGLEWHPSLLESTFNQLSYWGDRLAYKSVQGFDRQHPLSKNWESVFDAWDQRLINLLMEKELIAWGYRERSSRWRWMLPILIAKPLKCEWQALRQALQSRQVRKTLRLLRKTVSRSKLMFQKWLRP